jgi:hypothetical protein
LLPVAPVIKRKSDERTQLNVVIAGDKRLAENVILEVRAIARRLGTQIPKIEVVRQPSAGLKAKRQRSVRRKAK